MNPLNLQSKNMNYYEKLDRKYNLITLALCPIVLPLLWALLVSADKPNPINRKAVSTMQKLTPPPFEPVYAVIYEDEIQVFQEDYFTEQFHLKDQPVSSMEALLELFNDYQVIDQVGGSYISKRKKKKYTSNTFLSYEITLSRELTTEEQNHISIELLD